MEVRAKKALGQHFLTDQSIAKAIVDALDTSGRQTPADTLEIGPGMGVYSRYSRVLEAEPMGGCFMNCNTPEELARLEDLCFD